METLIITPSDPVRGNEIPCGRSLSFVEPSPEAWAGRISDLWKAGPRPTQIVGDRSMTEQVVMRLRRELGSDVSVMHGDGKSRLPGQHSIVVYCHTNESLLGDQLLEHLDAVDVSVVAPRLRSHYAARPSFLISIPKSGTHLLYELARAFGYSDGVIHNGNPVPKHWYCIEYSNSHTRADDFLIDTTRRAPFGNKDHPFRFSPAMLIYRDPRDILVSEARWFHKHQASPLSGYFHGLTFEERLLTLIDDPWLMGSIRQRVGGFIPWLRFPNVLPVSFEELVGDAGGGSDAERDRTIWSLMLRLQVDGSPESKARSIFRDDSPTFSGGQIGAWAQTATEEAERKFSGLPQDFMRILGYSGRSGRLPDRREEFRMKPLKVLDSPFSETPILVQTNYFRHNIVRLGGRYYGVPQSLGAVDLAQTKRLPKGVLVAESEEELRAMIAVRRGRGWLWAAFPK